jgi:hypothetical protein
VGQVCFVNSGNYVASPQSRHFSWTPFAYAFDNGICPEVNADPTSPGASVHKRGHQKIEYHAVSLYLQGKRFIRIQGDNFTDIAAYFGSLSHY